MPLDVRRRAGREGWWITGTVTPAGAAQGVRIRRRAGSDDLRVAREEATALEASILRDHHLGRRPAARGWGEAVASYTTAEPRAAGELRRLIRLTQHLGDTPLDRIGQEAVDRARGALLRPGASMATALREIVVPIRAVLRHAARRGWCSEPMLETPTVAAGRTRALLPAEVEALIAAAAPHLRPLLTWLVCTGCRLGESLALDWADVDLQAARARLWGDTTKAGRSRLVSLPPAAVAAMAGLPHRDGAVFRTRGRAGKPGTPYRQSGDGYGGQIKTAWATACREAKLAGVSPHDLRHTWASWSWAMERDLLRLRDAGGWSSVALVERYAHLLPEGQEAGIRRVWGLAQIARNPRKSVA